jgi:hypothetical protein
MIDVTSPALLPVLVIVAVSIRVEPTSTPPKARPPPGEKLNTACWPVQVSEKS